MIDLGYHLHVHISYEGQTPPLCIGALHRDDGMWTVVHPIGGYYSFHPDTDPFTVTDDCSSAARTAVRPLQPPRCRTCNHERVAGPRCDYCGTVAGIFRGDQR